MISRIKTAVKNLNFLRHKKADPISTPTLSREEKTEQIEKAVAYAVQVASNYIKRAGGPEILKGKNVVEIGPGSDIGSSLMLSFCGAQIFIIDRFLPAWDETYHPEFYQILRDYAIQNIASPDLSVIDSVIKHKGYPENALTVRKDYLENINLPDNSADFIFSNAVLVHLTDATKGLEQLGRISKAGAMGFHQVDMRFHFDFSKPLDYLLMTKEEFEAVFQVHNSGSPRRQFEYAKAFADAGFEILEFKANLPIDEAYLQDTIIKLRNSHSPYKDLPEEQLRIISGHFTVCKNR